MESLGSMCPWPLPLLSLNLYVYNMYIGLTSTTAVFFCGWTVGTHAQSFSIRAFIQARVPDKKKLDPASIPPLNEVAQTGVQRYGAV